MSIKRKKLTVCQILEMLNRNSDRYFKLYRDSPTHPRDAAFAQSIIDQLITNIKLGVIDEVGSIGTYGSDELARIQRVEYGLEKS